MTTTTTTTTTPQTAEEALAELITSYHELNGNHIDELEQPPSPLLFMQYVARNRPFVVRKAAVNWPAVSLWSPDHLTSVMGDSTVKVAMTPSGNADSAVRNSVYGKLTFAKPLEIDEKFEDFLSNIRRQEIGGEEASPTAGVRYSQAQNDNMRNEYSTLYSDVPADIPWATESLGDGAGAGPDAINLWIGNSRSVTALHKDNYENIYAQVRGEKCFVLLPPVETPCVNMTYLEQATYARGGGDAFTLIPEPSSDKIPWAIWDPDTPDTNATALSHLSRPLRVDLAPGDLLYLPALWYHKVTQRCYLDDNISISVNYWYDMSYNGFLYPANAFITGISAIINGEV